MEMLKNLANYERSNRYNSENSTILLRCKIIVNNTEINEDKRISNEFNNFFIDIDPEQQKTCKIFQKLCTKI